MGVAPLSVAFVCSDPDSSSARVRVLDRLPGLAAHGVSGELLALPRGWLARRRFFRALGAHDVVVLARRLVGEGDLVALRRGARALVLDLDDAVWTRPSGRRDRRAARRFADAVRAADVVVVGSPALREEVRGRHGHPRVRLVPPASPLPSGAPAPPTGARPGPSSTGPSSTGPSSTGPSSTGPSSTGPSSTGPSSTGPSSTGPSSIGPSSIGDDPAPLRLVWTGSRSTLPYLERLGPVLEVLAGEVPLRVEVVADAPARLPTGVPITFTPWSLEAEDAALRRADVGLYPSQGDAWSRGKCAYKLRRYMAFGLPSVASRAGAGLETLDPPEAGLVADDEGEWLQALRTLAADPALRRRMGARARGLALTRDDPSDRARSLARILGQAAAIGRLRDQARAHRGPSLALDAVL